MTVFCKQVLITILKWLLAALEPGLTPPQPSPQAGRELRYRVDPAMAKAVGGSDAAILVERLLFWMRHNEANQSQQHYRMGQWWTWHSYQGWADDALPWLTGDQVRRIFMKLEKLGVVQAVPFNGRGKPKWYSVDTAALGTLANLPATLANLPATLANLPATLMKSPATPTNPPALSSIESSESNPSSEIQLDLIPPTAPERDDGNLFSEWAAFFGKARPTTRTRLLKEVERVGLVQARAVAQRCADAQGKTWQYVLTALKNETPPPNPLPASREGERAAAYGSPPPVARPPSPTWEGSYEELLAWRREQDAHEAALVAARKPQRPAEIDNFFWKIAKTQLEIQLDRVAYHTWVKDLILVSVEDGVYTLDAPSAYTRDIVQNRLYRTIWRVLSDLAGSDVKIEVVVGDAPPPPPVQAKSGFGALGLAGSGA